MDTVIAVTGRNTTIVKELSLYEPVERIEKGSLPLTAQFVLAAGVLVGKRISDMTAIEAYETVNVNLIETMRICERILSTIPTARICVVGSCSGIKGSYDQLYGASKAGIHHYIKTRKVLDTQQLVAVSPCIIRDSGMTERRSDYPRVLEERETVSAKQVADVIYGLLTMTPAISNEVVPVGPC
jgi:NADP-dependent 3-hydroxy acid dehydrogenase YdfG